MQTPRPPAHEPSAYRHLSLASVCHGRRTVRDAMPYTTTPTNGDSFQNGGTLALHPAALRESLACPPRVFQPLPRRLSRGPVRR